MNKLQFTFFLFFFFFLRLCEPGNRENRDAFYPHPVCQVDKGRLPRHFSFPPFVIGYLNMKESGCTLHKPLTLNRIYGIGIACRDCETGKISDGITGFRNPIRLGVFISRLLWNKNKIAYIAVHEAGDKIKELHKTFQKV